MFNLLHAIKSQSQGQSQFRKTLQSTREKALSCGHSVFICEGTRQELVYFDFENIPEDVNYHSKASFRKIISLIKKSYS